MIIVVARAIQNKIVKISMFESKSACAEILDLKPPIVTLTASLYVNLLRLALKLLFHKLLKIGLVGEKFVVKESVCFKLKYKIAFGIIEYPIAVVQNLTVVPITAPLETKFGGSPVMMYITSGVNKSPCPMPCKNKGGAIVHKVVSG